jgi:FSR family fosmidomycin resistance protein-like MFS transporter
VREAIDKRAMTLLGSGHLATDFAVGSLPALIPYLKDRFQLSYTLAAMLVLASSASSSVVQPLFGLWSDRRGALWLLPGGVAVAGLGIALAADAPSYWLVVVLVVVSGLGSAAYHPEGSKFAAYASGIKRASGMSAFSIGGNVGYALGPILAGGLVAAIGLRGGLFLVIPCAAVALVLAAHYRELAALAPTRERRVQIARGGQDQIGALGLLLGLIAFRSLSWFGLITFVPLWEVSLGHSKSYGTHLLALMLLTGGLGTIAAGPLADRIGVRRVLLMSLVATPALISAYVVLGGVAGAVCLALVGVCIIGTFGVSLVMSQDYLPTRIGLASGLSIGLSVGLGGVGAVVLGVVADSVDLRATMWTIAAAPVVAVGLGLLLPSVPRRTPVALRPSLEP